MMAAMLKFMFIYNQFMMLDDTSFRKCVCGVTSLFNKIKHSPYPALSMMADIDTLSIENCEVKIVKSVFLYNIYILRNFVLVLNMC
jgi:hypothetical protein